MYLNIVPRVTAEYVLARMNDLLEYSSNELASSQWLERCHLFGNEHSQTVKLDAVLCKDQFFLKVQNFNMHYVKEGSLG